VRGSVRVRAIIISKAVSPPNGGVPASISWKMTPRLKTSERASAGCPFTCSGDMYCGVPRSAPAFVIVESAADVASPKSVT